MHGEWPVALLITENDTISRSGSEEMHTTSYQQPAATSCFIWIMRHAAISCKTNTISTLTIVIIC